MALIPAMFVEQLLGQSTETPPGPAAAIFLAALSPLKIVPIAILATFAWTVALFGLIARADGRRDANEIVRVALAAACSLAAGEHLALRNQVLPDYRLMDRAPWKAHGALTWLRRTAYTGRRDTDVDALFCDGFINRVPQARYELHDDLVLGGNVGSSAQVKRSVAAAC